MYQKPIEDLWSILKGSVYDNGWRAKNLDELKNKTRLFIRKLDPALVQRLITSTFKRLDQIQRSGLIENRQL